MLPTCAYVDTPEITGTLTASDVDGDLALAKVSFYVGTRIDESEVTVTGMNYSGPLSLTFSETEEGSIDVRIKVTDAAGAQSASRCNTVRLVK